jgi:hypothetical protein
MSELRPWQMALFIGAFLVFAGSVLYQCKYSDSAEVTLPDSVTMVDMATGDLFESPLPKKRAVSFPAPHPDTKANTLFPADLIEGKWCLDRRYVPYIKELVPKGDDLILDRKSGEVKITSPKLRSVNVF